MNFKSLIFVLVIIVSLFDKSTEISLEQDLTISSEQYVKLTKFRERVLRHLPHDYMKLDIYLIRWLRARNFDIPAAEKMLLDNLQWRADNNMDTIHEEDWSDFESSYKYYTDGHDKEGRPICFLSLGTWDIRKAIVTGQRDRLARYIDKATDHISSIVREEQAQGKNVSQFNFIANIAGYNVIQQGCLQCIQMYIHLISTYEQHFPNTADKLMTLNTPDIFQVVLNAMRPFMSPGTTESLKVYGTNRQDWEPIVYKDFDRDQLPEEIKGTKIIDDY